MKLFKPHHKISSLKHFLLTLNLIRKAQEDWKRRRCQSHRQASISHQTGEPAEERGGHPAGEQNQTQLICNLLQTIVT